MRNLLKKLWKDESAVSATEYGIIAAVLAIGLIGILAAFRGKIRQLFNDTGNDLVGAGDVQDPT